MPNDSCKSGDEKAMKNQNPIVFDSEIFDTEGNDGKKSNQPQIFRSKFLSKRFILKKKSKPKALTKKRLSTDDSNRSSKKPKLQPIVQEDRIIKSEISSAKIDEQVLESSDQKEAPIVENNQSVQPGNLPSSPWN